MKNVVNSISIHDINIFYEIRNKIDNDEAMKRHSKLRIFYGV